MQGVLIKSTQWRVTEAFQMSISGEKTTLFYTWDLNITFSASVVDDVSIMTLTSDISPPLPIYIFRSRNVTENNVNAKKIYKEA